LEEEEEGREGEEEEEEEEQAMRWVCSPCVFVCGSP